MNEKPTAGRTDEAAVASAGAGGTAVAERPGTVRRDENHSGTRTGTEIDDRVDDQTWRSKHDRHG